MHNVNFNYGRAISLFTVWGFSVLVALNVFALWEIENDNCATGWVILAIAYAGFMPLFVNHLFMRSSLSLNEYGISAKVFGYVWRRIEWCEVTVVKSARWRNPGYKTPSTTFLICQRDGNRFAYLRGGPIVFDDTIQGLISLVNMIQSAAIEHGFPTVEIN